MKQQDVYFPNDMTLPPMEARSVARQIMRRASHHKNYGMYEAGRQYLKLRYPKSDMFQRGE